jgi:hypothetical protein
MTIIDSRSTDPFAMMARGRRVVRDKGVVKVPVYLTDHGPRPVYDARKRMGDHGSLGQRQF